MRGAVPCWQSQKSWCLSLSTAYITIERYGELRHAVSNPLSYGEIENSITMLTISSGIAHLYRLMAYHGAVQTSIQNQPHWCFEQTPRVSSAKCLPNDQSERVPLDSRSLDSRGKSV